MSDKVGAVADLASALDTARASDRRMGQEIASNADVNFTTQENLAIAFVAATPTSGGRTVRFTVGSDRIRWSCTCTDNESPWCKHVVAAILSAGTV